MKHEEFNIQKSLVKYARLKYPTVKFCGSSGGMRTSMGQAVKNKAAGYSKGFPDIFFPIPKHGYAGLFIEIKKEDGGVKSKEQKEWVAYLNKQGYKASFGCGLSQCMQILDDYLEGV